MATIATSARAVRNSSATASNCAGQGNMSIVMVLTALVLDRPRHADLIAAIRKTQAGLDEEAVEFWREVGSVMDGDLVRTVTIRQRADSLIDLRRVILLSDLTTRLARLRIATPDRLPWTSGPRAAGSSSGGSRTGGWPSRRPSTTRSATTR